MYVVSVMICLATSANMSSGTGASSGQVPFFSQH